MRHNIGHSSHYVSHIRTDGECWCANDQLSLQRSIFFARTKAQEQEQTKQPMIFFYYFLYLKADRPF